MMQTSRHAWQPLIDEREAANPPGIRVADVPGAGSVTIRQRYEWNCGWVDNAALRRLFTEAHKWQS